MNISVGLMEAQPAVQVELMGPFTDAGGRSYTAGRHRFTSEISASCPLELLKAHAVISRSWLLFPKESAAETAQAQARQRAASEDHRRNAKEQHEIVRWYGREAHPDFDVCADDHCQRYQGI